jgi:hypothetical protein
MADYTQSKGAMGKVADGTMDAAWSRYEPLISPDRIRDEILWGIPLVSFLTGQQLSNGLLEKKIKNAVSLVEQETGIDILPTQQDERHPFDKNEFESMGYMRLWRRPVLSIEQFNITSSSGEDLFAMSLDWIDPGYLNRGLVYIIPMNVALVTQMSASGGAAFLAILGQLQWVPAYWRVRYTSGFADGKLPTNINLLIGYTAAIDILNELAAINAKSGSHSISIDGLSQSVSNPGPEVYKAAIEALEKKKTMLVGKIKVAFGTKYAIGTW